MPKKHLQKSALTVFCPLHKRPIQVALETFGIVGDNFRTFKRSNLHSAVHGMGPACSLVPTLSSP